MFSDKVRQREQRWGTGDVVLKGLLAGILVALVVLIWVVLTARWPEGGESGAAPPDKGKDAQEGPPTPGKPAVRAGELVSRPPDAPSHPPPWATLNASAKCSRRAKPTKSSAPQSWRPRCATRIGACKRPSIWPIERNCACGGTSRRTMASALWNCVPWRTSAWSRPRARCGCPLWSQNRGCFFWGRWMPG
jgi:hypothetical protein